MFHTVPFSEADGNFEQLRRVSGHDPLNFVDVKCGVNISWLIPGVGLQSLVVESDN